MKQIFDIITEHGQFRYLGTTVLTPNDFMPITVYSGRSVDRILSVFKDVPFSNDISKSSYISHYKL